MVDGGQVAGFEGGHRGGTEGCPLCGESLEGLNGAFKSHASVMEHYHAVAYRSNVLC